MIREGREDERELGGDLWVEAIDVAYLPQHVSPSRKEYSLELTS